MEIEDSNNTSSSPVSSDNNEKSKSKFRKIVKKLKTSLFVFSKIKKNK